MARPWLKVEPAVLKHPKTRALAKLWGCHPYQVVGFLVALWGYCLEFQEDGNVRACPPDVLDELATPCLGRALGVVQSVLDALQSVGFADDDGYLHDWDEFTGGMVVHRRNERERKRLARKAVRRTSASLPLSGGPDVRDLSATRVEQSRVEQSRSAAAQGADAALLHESIPPAYHDALAGHLRAARSPSAVAASIRALGPGGIHEHYDWETIGRALFELAADRDPTFNARRLDAFCRKLGEAPPAGAPGAPTDAERMRQARERVEAPTP